MPGGNAPRVTLRLAVGDALLGLGLLLAGGFLPPWHGPAGVVPAALLGSAGLALLLAGNPRVARLVWALPLLLLTGWLPAPARAAAWWLLLGLVRLGIPGSARLELIAGSAAFLALLSLALHLPQAWFLFDGLGRAQGWLLGLLSGRATVLGEGPLLHIPLFFLIRACVALLLGGGARRLMATLAGWAAFLLLLAGLWRWGPAEPAHLVLLLPLLGYLLFHLADSFAGEPSPHPAPGPAPTWRALPAVGASLALALLLLPPPLDLDGLRVGFRREGLWSPAPPTRDDGASPRLGGVIRGLRAWGLPVELLGDSLLERGPAVDVLFLVQPDKPLSPELRASLRRWLEAGGVLVAVGEHTHVHGIGEGLGSLLQDYAVKLRDDSALPALNGWQWGHNLRVGLSPLAPHVPEGHRLGISVGASLDLSLPAWPLVSGCLAFADAGDAGNPRGRMGNTRWDAGERWGGIVLAAAQPVGKGRLVVLGDKSPFMSLNNPRNMDWLLRLGPGQARGPGWREGRTPRLLLLLLLGATLVPLLRGRRLRHELPAALALTAALGAVLRAPELPPPSAKARGDIVWIDQSHQPADWLPPSHDWSPSALVDQVVLSGQLPLQLHRLDDAWLEGSRALLVSGSARPYHASQRAILRRYVEGGGRLVVTVDGRRAAGLRGLLREFGFAVGTVPLGSAEEAVGPAGPLGFPFWEAWDLQDLEGGADTLASCWGLPFVFRRELGRGSVVVVGDERAGSRWFLEGDTPGGTGGSTATRFRTSAGREPFRLPHPERVRYEERRRARHQAVAPSAAVDSLDVGPARKRTGRTAADPVALRRAWFRGLLGLGPLRHPDRLPTGEDLP